MAVEVRWFPTLAKRTRSGELTTTVPWSPGLTALTIFAAEGFSEVDAAALMTIVNGSKRTVDVELEDGDSVEFLVNLQGG